MSVLPLNRKVIYALVDPRDGMVRYVGLTSNPVQRFKDHLQRPNRGTKSKNKWIEELKVAGLKPIFIYLDSVKEECAEREEIAWIQHFQTIGELFNHKQK